MNDKELAALRIAASKALGKAITHLETTEQERLSASREFEAKTIKNETEQKLRAQPLRSIQYYS